MALGLPGFMGCDVGYRWRDDLDFQKEKMALKLAHKPELMYTS